MNTVRARVLALSILLMGAMILSMSVASANASAASVSGTWGSRIPGEGYTQTHIGPLGNVVTDKFDVELQLSGSEGEIYGTLKSWNQYGTQEYSVTGTVSGSTFYMTAYFGWDGVNYLTPTYALAIDGDTMFGSGSYVNVGVTITGTFDLEKEGLFAVGGITPVVSAVSITIAIVAIVVAASPAKVSPKGYPPQATKHAPQTPGYEPSRQWTTEMPHQPVSGDGAVPVGGVGVHYPSPPPAGRPLPPRDHFADVSQEPPRCPVHNDVALTPHYSTDMNDPGSWYCPRCEDYPWGRS